MNTVLPKLHKATKRPSFVALSLFINFLLNLCLTFWGQFIDKVNERFDGQFTDADRVIIEGIYRMFMDDKDVKKFKKYASDNSTEMFVNSLFPEKFKEIVTQCFLNNNESFQKLFNDPEFYQKVQDVMAKELYKSLRKDS